MTLSNEGRRKPYRLRVLTNRSVSRRKAAGTRRNKRLKFVGSFKSDQTN